MPRQTIDTTATAVPTNGQPMDIAGLPADVQAALKELDTVRAENARLKAAKPKAGKVTVKVSAKGACSVYGLGRFPVTLYGSQWARLFEHVNEIKAFLQDHKGDLATKD